MSQRNGKVFCSFASENLVTAFPFLLPSVYTEGYFQKFETSVFSQKTLSYPQLHSVVIIFFSF